MAAVLNVLTTRIEFLPAPAQLALLIACGSTVYGLVLIVLWPKLVRRVWNMVVRRRAATAEPTSA
jgi:hypothetical protein